MKCIKCYTDNNLKDRKSNHGHCKKCRHEFAFDPKLMSGVDFTDSFFQRVLEKVSANNSLFFTSRQLYYCFNERHKYKTNPLKLAGCGLLAIAVVSVMMIAAGLHLPGFVILVLAISFAVAIFGSASFRRRLLSGRTIPLRATNQQVDTWFRRWCKINGNVPKLLPPLTALPRSNAETNKISPEVKQYSFDRAVICESDEIARCLITNNFHFENNSAVLSVDGYPQDVFDTVMDMLRRNPDLHVYALHDASKRGVALPHTLSTETRWFAGSTVKIFDLGLLPRQIMARSVIVEKERPNASETIPQPIMATLRPEEVSWFSAGNFVVLESFPPKVLLRIVARGIAKSRTPESEDALAPVIWMDGDPGIYYYGAESFG